MESERDGPRVAPEPTMRSDLEDMPELSDTMMAPEEESDDVINVPEVWLESPDHVIQYICVGSI